MDDSATESQSPGAVVPTSGSQSTTVAQAATPGGSKGIATTPRTPSNAIPSSSSGELQEVVVTAERRAENLQQTPLTVTVLSSQALQQFNVATTSDLMQVAAGLQVATQTAGDAGGSATFFLRGLGQERAGNGSSPAVGIYVDDLYYPSLQGSIFSILDMQQIQVLRGPQGTLFGRNTIGGAIVYTTKSPTNEFEATATFTGGSLGRNDLIGTLNLPVTDMIDLRFTAGRLQTSGYVRQQDGGVPAGGTETNLGRVQVRIKPASSVTVDLVAQLSRQELDGLAYVMPGPINPVPGTLPFIWNHIPPLGGVNPYDSRYASTCDWCQYGTAQREFSDTHNSMVSSTIAWDVSQDITLTSITGLIKVSDTNFSSLSAALPIFQNRDSGWDRALSQELRVNGRSFDDTLNWVGGLYYFDEKSWAHNIGTVLGKTAVGDSLNATQSRAAYLDATYSITKQLAIFAGGRTSEDKKQFHNFTNPDVTGNARFPSNTGRAGLKYQWNPNIMTYASVSNGFRSGGYNPVVNGVVTTFRPEQDTSYEIGARMDFADKRIRINPTLFYTRYSAIQVQNVVPTPTGVQIVLQNVARGRTAGGELEAQAVVTDNVRVFANVAGLASRFDDVGNASDINIHSLFAHAPKWSGSTGVQHTLKLAAGSVTTTLNWSWEDKQRSTPEDNGEILLPSYGLLGARVEFDSVDEHWMLAVFADNVLNKVYYTGGVNYAVNVSSKYETLGLPREIAGTLRYRF